MWQVLLAILILLFILYKRDSQLPPGPLGLPFLGYVPFIDSNSPHKTFHSLFKKYGDIYSLNVFGKLFVILNDYNVVNKVFAKNSCIGRPELHSVEMLYEEKIRGIFNTSGDYWKNQRKAMSLFMKYIIDNGFLAQTVQSELDSFLQELDHKYDEKKPCYPMPHLMKNSLGVAWRLIFGEPAADDNEIVAFACNEGSEKIKDLNFLFFVGFLPKIIRDHIKVKFVEDVHEKRQDVRNFIKETKMKDHYINGKFHCFIRYYLDMAAGEQEKKIECEDIEEDLLGLVIDFLSGASETTSSTIAFCYLFCIAYPDVQDKLHREIVSICGDSPPAFGDLGKFHYFNAFLMEVMRLSSIIPLISARTNIEDITVDKYIIPKGSIIIPSGYSVHHNPRYWGTTEEFRPERHLNGDNSFGGQKEGFLGFSTGKRVCLGSTMAKVEVFLFVTTVLQKYKLVKDESMKTLTTEPTAGLVLQPPHYQFVLQLRNQMYSAMHDCAK